MELKLPPKEDFISNQEPTNPEGEQRLQDLTRALMEELGLESDNLLASWVTDYIAQKIILADDAEGEEKVKAQQLCFDSILKLWQHHTYFPQLRHTGRKKKQAAKTPPSNTRIPRAYNKKPKLDTQPESETKQESKEMHIPPVREEFKTPPTPKAKNTPSIVEDITTSAASEEIKTAPTTEVKKAPKQKKRNLSRSDESNRDLLARLRDKLS